MKDDPIEHMCEHCTGKTFKLSLCKKDDPLDVYNEDTVEWVCMTCGHVYDFKCFE